MENIDRLFGVANERHHTFPPPEPQLGLVVLTCMDARIDPHAILGVGLGDAHIIRNAGGMVTDDVVESLAISQKLVGTSRIMVIHHTNCLAHGERAPGYSPYQTARWVVQQLRNDPRLPHRDKIRGFVLDTANVGAHTLSEA